MTANTNGSATAAGGPKPSRKWLLIAPVLVALILCAWVGWLPPHRSRAAGSQTYTVGVLNINPTMHATLEGFKTGMSELGHVEGRNITYIYDGPVKIPDLSAAGRRLMELRVDMILALSTPATLAARQAARGTNVPVVFVPVSDPVGAGVVRSLRDHDRQITGIKGGGFVPKQLEWFLRIAPGIRRVFVLHNPDDGSSVLNFGELSATARILGVDLLVRETTTHEEVIEAIASVPVDVDAMFILPSSLVSSHAGQIGRVALERKMPLATLYFARELPGSLMSYGVKYDAMGRQAARLADQLIRSPSPLSIPVETADFYLAINLRTARAIGLDVPEQILRQADSIIR